MGKIKDLFLKMLEEAELEQVEEPSFETDILCPNCLNSKLHETSPEDLHCTDCGYEFIKVEDSIRFK